MYRLALLLGAAAAPWMNVVHAIQKLEAEPVIVTATRSAQTVDDTLASVTVLDQADLARLQVESLQDALRALPGVAVSNNGGLGKSTFVNIRGTESDHVLVLIDGIKVGSATAGTTAFEQIPIDQIERIEVVRGPRSSLYGSEALGGVIQLFTRKGSGPARGFFEVGGGSHRGYKTAVGASAGGERTWINTSASALATGGFDSCRGDPLIGGCFTIEPDHDGFRSQSGSFRFGHRFNNDTEIDLHALRVDGFTDFDGGAQNEADLLQQIAGAHLRFAPLTDWRVRLAAGQSRDDQDNFKDSNFASRFDTKRDSMSLQNDFSFGSNQLIVVGFDYLDDRIDSSSNFAVRSRYNKGRFGQYQEKSGPLDFQFALRHDDNEQFGRETTGSLALGFDITSTTKTYVSHGTAFKAPSFNELYFPGFGNANLMPETAKSTEVGVRGKTGQGRWTLAAFHTEIDDLIAIDPTLFTPVNVNRARIRGLEASILTQLQGWRFELGATLLDPENRSPGANRGNDLPRRSPRTLRLDADRQWDRFSLGFTIVAEDQRFDDLANRRELPGYATLDARMQYPLGKHWSVSLSVKNLLDKEYETAEFYNQDGRNAFLLLRYRSMPKGSP